MRYDIIPFEPIPELQESIQYKTDVITSYSGLEQRRSLLDIPDNLITYDYSLTDPQHIAVYEAILHTYNGQEMYVPLWNQFINPSSVSGTTITCSTDNLCFADSRYVLLYNDWNDFEIMTIDSFDSSSITTTESTTGSYTTSSLICPCYKGFIKGDVGKDSYTTTFSEFGLTYILSDNVALSDLTDVVINPSLTYLSHLGIEVFQENIGKETSLKTRIKTLKPELFTGFGKYSQDNRLSFNNNEYTQYVYLNSREEIYNFKRWLQERKGKYTDFFCPLQDSKLEVVENVGATDTQIKIKNIGYTSNYNLHARRIDLLLVTSAGSWIPRRITACEIDADPDYELLTINADLDAAYTTSELTTYFLDRRRLLADKIVIKYEHLNQAISEIPTIGIVQ
jgi:hypothetical protein